MENENNIRTVALFTPTITKKVQCIGKTFLKHYSRANNHGIGFQESASSSTKVSDQDLNIVVDVEYLRCLDPKEWKDQDHYAVLGLKEMRFNASDDDIKRAYRKIVLKHHPDKRKAQGEEIRQEDDYFTCITRAYEILGNPTKRRSYDSIDPEFDDSLPTTTEVEKDFFNIFEKCFSLNARWSDKKRVPKIGDDNSPREDVDKFYNFWYNFDSWREYSYLDEEDKEKGQDRDERRWIEKQNKTIRAKRKKEEMARIRTLVDLAYNNDPRITKFKQEEKDRKLASRRAKQDAAQALKAEEDRVIREAQIAKDKAEQAEQKRIEIIRLEREQQKRALKRERKIFRDSAKTNNYYTNDDKHKLANMEGVEKIIEMLKFLEIQELNKKLKEKNCNDVFKKVLKETEEKLEEERKSLFVRKTDQNSTTNSSVKVIDKSALWTPDNMQVLIKAVNLFPAGTVQRWEVIANFLNQHGTLLNDRKFLARDVLNKAKDLQHTDFTRNVLKAQANENAFVSFEKSKKELKIVDEADISVNSDAVINTNKKQTQSQTTTAKKEKSPEMDKIVNGIGSKKQEQINNISKSAAIITNNVCAAETTTETITTTVNSNKISSSTTTTTITSSVQQQKQEDTSKTWTKDEQALLEQAIKTYPITTPDRWDRIAECLPNRNKKDCLRRVKELVDRVNAKREAQQIIK